jgi:hypothetical protein
VTADLIGPAPTALTVDGTAMARVLATDTAPAADVTAARVTLSDGVNPVTVDAGGLAAGASAQQSWTASFTAEQVAGLAEGPITVSATYTVEGSAEPLSGKTLTIRKDLTPPVVTPNPAPGTYGGELAVGLSAGEGETIRYTTDGRVPGPSSSLYGAPVLLPVGTTTLRVWARDAAGNVSTSAFTYTRTGSSGSGGNSGPGGSSGPSGAPLTDVVTILQAGPVRPGAPAESLPVVAGVVARSTPAAAPRVSGLRLPSSASLASVRRRGVTASFVAPPGARLAQVRLYERRGATRRLVASRAVTVRAGRRATVRFGDARLRRKLRSGSYVLTVQAGATRATLGTAVSRGLRIAG